MNTEKIDIKEGIAHYQSIKELIESCEENYDKIQEYPFSVQVRSGWHSPCDKPMSEEYEILLSTGGPACRIVGDLDLNLQPYNASLQVQEWGTPWTDIRGGVDENVLLKFASEFYFGE